MSESGVRSKKLDLLRETRDTSRRDGTLDLSSLKDVAFSCASGMGYPSVLKWRIGPVAMWMGAQASSGTGDSYSCNRRDSSRDSGVVVLG